MKICIPVEEDQGMDSRVCAHFGSAPLFMIIDSDTKACEAISNSNMHHQHGMCSPLAALAGHQIDGLVVGGIGMGALVKLQAAGIQAFLAESPTVKETIDAYLAGNLKPVTAQTACGQHGQGHGPGHHGGPGQGGCGR
ncbi:MAG: NifB/NifX family molybdenum-iron cluster-binding protein [Planctomycetota bacterium]